ncbi:carbohydrate-binding module family 18 protein [Hypoxylon trugodes]|uniref:carbohydrate-binding module family 18 protein n=1 Tax=Hypoxylon trugodes TaxID=326681 RepID=UPI002194BA68|nr:carbohydrate-binding module family 18 protein [Hypoxylon trugodes]KAI1393386.1 carbohydrate-binding module family 18 protein [Hypoxylon trugodes]
MKLSSEILGGLAMAGCAIAGTTPLRNVVYFDEYHKTILPNKNVTAGITHVVMAFANSSLFTAEVAGTFEPWMSVDQIRAMFDRGAQVGIAIGGWGDTAGFSAGAKTDASRKTYAQNVAKMVEENNFDFVDVDWEYPGGDGEDYKQIPNSNKTTEITTFPLFLREIKTAITPKQLSIASPARQPDMIAYTGYQAPEIFAAVDMVNLMTYDIMNRRDNKTLHHSSVKGSLEVVQRYLDLGLAPEKLNLGLAYYAKYFETPANSTCDHPIGCPIVKAENDDGTDAGTSGTVTYEYANVHPASPPNNLTATTDGTCGAGTFLTCSGYADGGCCSTAGYCGDTSAHCGLGCQSGYGKCTGPSLTSAYAKAIANGKLDEAEGGMWYWDSEANLFWTWDSADLMQRKFREIIAPLGLGGVMAWSLGEDSADWSHVETVNKNVKEMSAVVNVQGQKSHARAERKLRGRVTRPHGRLFA